MLKENGDKGDANDAVIKALQEANALIARGRLKHQYPHSWRSKKPVIFRNTPQWFIAMDRPIAASPTPTPGGFKGGAAIEASRCASSRCVPSARRNGCRRPARTASPA